LRTVGSLAAGTYLVAGSQTAASGGYSWPGLDITWLDFGQNGTAYTGWLSTPIDLGEEEFRVYLTK